MFFYNLCHMTGLTHRASCSFTGNLSTSDLGLRQLKRLPFLDTVTTRSNGKVEVDIYRKPTHTDINLHYDSHHPMQHKLSVLKTLLDRAEKIPSSNKGKRRERKHVFKVLRDNGYPFKFIKSYAISRENAVILMTLMLICIPLMSTTTGQPPLIVLLQVL